MYTIYFVVFGGSNSVLFIKVSIFQGVLLRGFHYGYHGNVHRASRKGG